ncbi:MAG TPA: ECF transporter S component [Candidatus Eremiobacteraeota bacterium]|nr:MAG: hypothetical protein BWY64_03315 [bacterium ADurb.Bin363]HPZ09267.1 ECF transporter S component [Candidatus Eremiobacteraeota bacterium]
MKTKETVMAGLFIAMGIVLPSFLHLLGMGKSFLPMHIPVLMAGITLGGSYGLTVGTVTPLLSFLLTGMPPFPGVIGMVFELGTYGFLTGFLSKKINIYGSVLIAMICSRVVLGIIYYLLLPLFAVRISFWYPLTGAFISSLPGIICQLALLPVFLVISKYKKIRGGEKYE